METGTRADPWQLTTPPGTSSYSMYRDDATLKYLARAIEDLHAWLLELDDWVPLGGADEKKPAADGTSRRGAARQTTRSAAGTACATATAGGSACICRH